MDTRRRGVARGLTTLLVVGLLHTPALGQGTGQIRGLVTFTAGGGPVHGAVVLVVGPSLVALTDEDGSYQLPDVPAGTYEVLAQREHMTAARQTVTLTAGGTHIADFTLDLTTIHEELTVTATAGGQTTAFEAFNAVSTLDAFELATDAQGSLGEALQNQPGVANRSFGPGASRPIIRGFDGDRVLLMEDGISSGDLSGQSGDHGVTIDPNGLERVEIERGPATLLYGSNAVGGVVNAITPHENHRDEPVPGTHGQLSADTGSAILNFASGDQHTLVWSWGIAAGANVASLNDVIGPKGSLQFGMTAAEPPKSYDSSTHGAFTLKAGKGREKVYTYRQRDMFLEEDKHVVKCFSQNEQPLVTAADGIAALKIAEAVLNGGRSKQTLKI